MPDATQPLFVLLDIEGTTTPVTFVHQVLFPFAREHMAGFLAANQQIPEVAAAVKRAWVDIQAETGEIPGTMDALAAHLRTWIDEDRKHPALKAIQGILWEDGYRRGSYRAEVYADVAPTLAAWMRRGIKLGIYSSGSVKAQHLLFEHTTDGDLRSFFAAYFDTEVGGKKEPESYATIATRLGLEPSQIVFLSDIGAELAAAATAGLGTIQIVRPGTTTAQGFKQAKDFFAADRMISANIRE